MKLINKKTNIRVDHFLSEEMLDLSRSRIQGLIEKGNVKVNDKVVVKKGFALFPGDKVEIKLDSVNSDEHIKEWDKQELIDVIFQNDDYLIINKPAGLSVHPGAGNKDETLVNILKSLKISLSNSESIRPGIVHRLDKDTSGLLIISKTDKFLAHIQKQFDKREIEKIYWGIVVGQMPHQSGLIDAPIGRDKKSRIKMTVTADHDARPAQTQFKVLQHLKDKDLVEFNLITGRTHQIRVHMKYINHPLYNDPVYGKQVDKSCGQFLHSKKITFKDLSGKKVTYEAEIPSYFKSIIEH